MSVMRKRRLFAGVAVAMTGVLVATLVGCRGLGANGVAGGDGTMPRVAVRNPGNIMFYAPDGAFKPGVAKDAYLAMMEAFGYPIPPVLRTDELWVCDFMDRDFEHLGMGGIFWINEKGTYGANGVKAYAGEFKDEAFGYLGHEIFLLPGQLLPEHRHRGGFEGYGPKMEAWQVRRGTVEFFGEYKGAGDETLIRDMPAHRRPVGFGEPWFKSTYVARRTVGELYSLEDPESWHCQRAGPNGAIVTEYATYHNHVEFSKPDMIFDSSKAK